MINSTFCIGIGGLARAGKDTLCNLLAEEFNAAGLEARRFALADDLKQKARSEIIEKFGIDIFNCTPEEKEMARPTLVDFGKQKRVKSDGTYWTDRLESKIAAAEYHGVAIIPDIRYSIYEKDENYWIQRKTQGLLVHVARYEIVDGQKVWLKPPNEDEAFNDPLIRQCADFSLAWETLPTDKLKLTYKGFLNTIVACAYVEINRQTRHRVN